MSWEEIKASINALYSQYVGSGNLIETDSGSPTQLAIIVNLVHNRIINYPINWSFLKETGTITLTGASSYNLATLFPDLQSVYQIYDGTLYTEKGYVPNYEANVSPIQEAYTLRGKTLIFTGNAPVGGTLSIQYKSKYMVKTAAGVRQKFFQNDDDVTVLDDESLLVWLTGEFINWTSDDTAVQRREEVRNWSKEAFSNLILGNENINQITSML